MILKYCTKLGKVLIGVLSIENHEKIAIPVLEDVKQFI